MKGSIDLSNNNVVHKKKENIEYLQFKKLLEYEDIITHAYPLGLKWDFRTANNGVITEEQLKEGLKNYKDFCDGLGVDYTKIIKPRQNHTDNVNIVEKKINKDQPDFNLTQYINTDGLITNKPNLVLSTTNADCILLLFFDPIKKVIANIHSGWRGTLQEISAKTVMKMKGELGCNTSDIICCMSPSIGKCHFEVDKDVMELFEQKFKKYKKFDFIEKQENREKWNIDTVLLNRLILKDIGLKDKNIIESGLCSVCNSNLIHSYRVEKKGFGLGTLLISLNNNK